MWFHLLAFASQHICLLFVREKYKTYSILTQNYSQYSVVKSHHTNIKQKLLLQKHKIVTDSALDVHS